MKDGSFHPKTKKQELTLQIHHHIIAKCKSYIKHKTDLYMKQKGSHSSYIKQIYTQIDLYKGKLQQNKRGAILHKIDPYKGSHNRTNPYIKLIYKPQKSYSKTREAEKEPLQSTACNNIRQGLLPRLCLLSRW